MARFDLTDFEWDLIHPLLPDKPRGVARVDDRRVVNGIFWVLRTGSPWRDLPERYGPYTTVYNRFNRWAKPNHPWTNGQVERMNRTIKDATVKRFHYDSHDQLRAHLADFLAAYKFARRLKTLGGLTPYEYICKIWTSEPDRFILDPIC